ncbi:MAG: PDZ domain-containing protein [Verrucomicrobiota bacterium JB023]|nr:PDZ domain-containing protein [Verrucomicrobiota bacterium JB023]
MPWLGVRLEWVDRALAEHLKGVPIGFGLLVEKVEEGSPAALAGLQELDVLWKFDDQLLANQWQLYSLMRLKGIDGEASLTVTRGGEPVVLPVVLSARPDSEKEEESKEAVVRIMSPPVDEGPVAVKQVFFGRRQATIEENGKLVSLGRKKNGFEYFVMEDGKLTERGELPSEEPGTWDEVEDADTKRKLIVLVESLADAEEREASEDKVIRVPRVRRVPTPDELEKGHQRRDHPPGHRRK